MLTLTVDPDTKFVPVNVTLTLLPGGAAFGLIEVRVGWRATMVKVAGLEVPPRVVTVNAAEPEAFAAIVSVAVI